MNARRSSRSRGALVAAGALTLAALAGAAAAQPARDLVDRLPAVIPAERPPLDQVLEFGLGLGRYDFAGSDQTSGFDSQFARYSRTRPGRDTWRADLGRQHRLDDTSLDYGLSYTRYLGASSLFAGIASGTGDVLAPRYRFDLGVAHPLGDFQARLGYTRVKSKAANSSHGWSAGLTRWFRHVILGAGYRVDYGDPGDTRSSSVSLGATWYRWRETYVGVGVDFGQVAYQLLGPGVPLSGGVLVDYDDWNLHLTATRYLSERSGLNLRYDHGEAKDIWTTDGVSASYFREW